MRYSAALMLLPLLAGCNVHSRNPADGDEKVSINADESGRIAFNLPIAQGKLKVPAGMMRNGDFDIDGVKLMPGSSVTGFSVFAGDKGANVTMAFKASASADQVRSYYLDQFRKQGVEAVVAGNGVQGKMKDGSPFAIQVSAAPSGSTGKIEIQGKN